MDVPNLMRWRIDGVRDERRHDGVRGGLQLGY